MNKPNLKQILSDMEEGKIVSKAFVKEALEYAVRLEDAERPIAHDDDQFNLYEHIHRIIDKQETIWAKWFFHNVPICHINALLKDVIEQNSRDEPHETPPFAYPKVKNIGGKDVVQWWLYGVGNHFWQEQAYAEAWAKEVGYIIVAPPAITSSEKP